MKKIIMLWIFVVTSIAAYAQKLSFGQITFTPYIEAQNSLDETSGRLLKDKMLQIVTANEAIGGFDRRFIITPNVNILSEKETATIPQKVSLKIAITFYVGDGVASALFASYRMEVSGVGDNRNQALHSAIRKIKVNDEGISNLISQGKERIIAYYNTYSSTLIKKAKSYMTMLDFENALSCLSTIPSVCKDYEQAQALIQQCGTKLIERNNDILITKAKSAWSANPNKEGASVASMYLSQIIVSSPKYRSEVQYLADKMQKTIISRENKLMELAKVQILSEERLQKEQIKASAQIETAFWASLPKIVYNVLKWF